LDEFLPFAPGGHDREKRDMAVHERVRLSGGDFGGLAGRFFTCFEEKSGLFA
jgi:hypothetical protein